MSTNTNTQVKDSTPSNNLNQYLPVGVPSTIYGIDSLEYQNYVQSGKTVSQYGIINVDSELKAQNSDYLEQINPIFQQIVDLYNKLFNATLSASNLMSQYNEGFANKAMVKHNTTDIQKQTEEKNLVEPYVVNSSLKESFSGNSASITPTPPITVIQKYDYIQQQIKDIMHSANIDNIFEERSLVAKQQNYIYIVITIVTLGMISIFYRYTKRQG